MQSKLHTPDPAQTHKFITTVSGKRILMSGPRPEQVDIDDIAHSLGMQCRYLGHCNMFYSVAEHSVLVAALARESGEASDVVRACLLHDAHEAYTGDFPSPFKAVVPDLLEWESATETIVRRAFRLPMGRGAVDLWATVKHFDIMALHVEAATLFDPVPAWVDLAMADDAKAILNTLDPIMGYRPYEATVSFLEACAKWAA